MSGNILSFDDGIRPLSGQEYIEAVQDGKNIKVKIEDVLQSGGDGISAFTLTTADFTQPAVNSNVVVSVAQAMWLAMGQTVYIENGGYYEVVSISGMDVTLKNLGYDSNAPLATVIDAGNKVASSGVKGDVGPAGPQGEQGVQGIQGETGPIGPAGPQGVQGIQGEQGIQGLPGEDGIDGTIVYTGTRTASFTIPPEDDINYYRYVSINPGTVTLPTNTNNPIMIGTSIAFRQGGGGQLTIVGDTGVTVNYPADLTNKTRIAQSTASVIKIGANEWDLTGDLEPVA